MNELLKEKSIFSARKIITYSTLIVFIGAQILWLIVNYKEMLPTAYWSSDVAIITFYFSKDFLRNLKVSSETK